MCMIQGNFFLSLGQHNHVRSVWCGTRMIAGDHPEDDVDLCFFCLRHTSAMPARAMQLLRT